MKSKEKLILISLLIFFSIGFAAACLVLLALILGGEPKADTVKVLYSCFVRSPLFE